MIKYLAVVPALLLCSQIPALADVIGRGTEIEVRPDARIDVSTWDRGRIYPAHVARDVIARDGDVAIPRGAEAELIVRQEGPGQLVLDLESITTNGRRYTLDTQGPEYNMSRDNYNDGRGIVGAIVGAIQGANGQAVSRGGEIRIPAESVVTFRLEQPIRIVSWQDPGYRRGEYHYHHDPDWYR